jgi:hypothetical protein
LSSATSRRERSLKVIGRTHSRRRLLETVSQTHLALFWTAMCEAVTWLDGCHLLFACGLNIYYTTFLL